MQIARGSVLWKLAVIANHVRRKWGIAICGRRLRFGWWSNSLISHLSSFLASCRQDFTRTSLFLYGRWFRGQFGSGYGCLWYHCNFCYTAEVGENYFLVLRQFSENAVHRFDERLYKANMDTWQFLCRYCLMGYLFSLRFRVERLLRSLLLASLNTPISAQLFNSTRRVRRRGPFWGSLAD